MTTEEQIINIQRQLLPTGRAFRTEQGSFRYRLFSAISLTEADAFDAAASTMDSLIPDNDRFNSNDATDWERRLGLVTNLLTPLADRKAAILRKMSRPAPNGHWLFIQGQLQDAGFNVYVHENRFPDYPSGYYEDNPATIYPSIFSQFQHGDGQHGDFQHGGYLNHIVVNSIYNEIDIRFNIVSLRTTFFIGGNVLGTMASVPATREIEFRQLILSLKQVQQAAILFINYI